MTDKRDLLDDLNSGRITSEQAMETLSAVLDSAYAGRVAEILGLNGPEWTAYAQGAPLLEIARWRKKGWPSTCIKCCRQIDVSAFGWRIVERGDSVALKHIQCPG